MLCTDFIKSAISGGMSSTAVLIIRKTDKLVWVKCCSNKAGNHVIFAIILCLYSDRTGKKMFIIFLSLMNFHAIKWKNLVFIRSDGISKCFCATRCNFLHKFEQRLSYIARACVEKIHRA